MMTSKFAAKLDFSTQLTNIRAQKIDGLALKTYGMAIAGFLIQDKLGKIRFFEETFLLADTSMEMVLGMLFLTFSNKNIQFKAGSLTWRSYTIFEALHIARQVKLIDKYEFAKVVLDKNFKTFVIYIAILEAPGPIKMTVHPSQAFLLAALQQNKAPIKNPSGVYGLY